MKDTIKTFEDACAARGYDPAKVLPDVSMMPEKHAKGVTAFCKLIIITEAINEGKEPDWSDSNQYKYYPYFRVDADKKRPAGFGFSRTYYDCLYTSTTVGSRLSFFTSDNALYVANQFEEIYKDLLLMMK